MTSRTPVPLPPVPQALAARADDPRFAAWVASLPALARGTLERWGLRLESGPDGAAAALPGAEDAQYSWVLPVRDDEDRALVLKLAFPDEEQAGEAPALKAWQVAERTAGAACAGGVSTVSRAPAPSPVSLAHPPVVALHRANPRSGTLLLDRLGPRSLHDLGILEACEVAGGVLAALRTPAPPTVPPLGPRVAGWLDDLEILGREVPAPPRLVDQAVRVGRVLLAATSDEEALVVHGELHYGNVLEAPHDGSADAPAHRAPEGGGEAAAPWRVIDPKGFAGDPAFDLPPLLWYRWAEATRHGNAAGAVLARFYAVVDAAGLDEERTRDWVIVRAMVGASWEVHGARGGQLSPAARELVTRYVTVAKAMAEVRAWSW